MQLFYINYYKIIFKIKNIKKYKLSDEMRPY